MLPPSDISQSAVPSEKRELTEEEIQMLSHVCQSARETQGRSIEECFAINREGRLVSQYSLSFSLVKKAPKLPAGFVAPCVSFDNVDEPIDLPHGLEVQDLSVINSPGLRGFNPHIRITGVLHISKSHAHPQALADAERLQAEGKIGRIHYCD